MTKQCYILSRVQLCATPWTVAHQAPLSMEFSRQKHQSGQPFLSPGNLPNLGIKPWSPALQADSSPSEPPGKPHGQVDHSLKKILIWCVCFIFFFRCQLKLVFSYLKFSLPGVSVQRLKCQMRLNTAVFIAPCEATNTLLIGPARIMLCWLSLQCSRQTGSHVILKQNKKKIQQYFNTMQHYVF